jgi:hypothetical protein
MQSKLPLLPSGPGGVRKSTVHGPWQRPMWRSRAGGSRAKCRFGNARDASDPRVPGAPDWAFTEKKLVLRYIGREPYSKAQAGAQIRRAFSCFRSKSTRSIPNRRLRLPFALPGAIQNTRLAWRGAFWPMICCTGASKATYRVLGSPQARISAREASQAAPPCYSN